LTKYNHSRLYIEKISSSIEIKRNIIIHKKLMTHGGVYFLVSLRDLKHKRRIDFSKFAPKMEAILSLKIRKKK